MNKVLDILINTSKKFPENIAVIDDKGVLSYKELFLEIFSFSEKLAEKGVKPGNAVGIMGHNSREFVIAALAASLIDAVVMPLSSALKKYELDSLLEIAPIDYIICSKDISYNISDEYKGMISTNENSLKFFHVLNKDNKSFRDIVPDAAFVRFTSGTTGSSKGVILSHNSVLERVNAANNGLKLSEKDVILWVLPMAFHFFVSIILYLSVGASIIICPDNLPDIILNFANKYKATFFYASPLHFKMLSSFEKDIKFQTLKTAVSTSTSIDTTTSENFFKKFNIPVSQAYGIIEIGLPMINTDNQILYPDSVGKAQKDYNIAILDENLNPLPPDSIGLLAIKGPGFFSAYYNPTKYLADILNDGWFLTGDIAKINSEGNIFILGRNNTIINVGGNKVFPEEVEEVLNTHPHIAASRVSAKKHYILGEIVHADIVLKNTDNFDKEEIISFCRKKLSPFKIPHSIDYVDKILETKSGKIIRYF